MYEVKDDIFLHSKQCDPKQSENHQLDWTDFTKHGPVGDQAAGHTEVSIDQAANKQTNLYYGQQMNQMYRTKKSVWKYLTFALDDVWEPS